ncbi:hypothetical protein [Methylobacterium haplocladii]|uniref:hypothetical protein n=1 Tax=Methylobacterium haplocladii TaxID=1176176 RepID=UPI00235D3429|nr:hypothetical protein [Methylobacterium haplocladii]GLS57859.1 hypothetical protein GCM10007887_05150 [Methylobacterium haplocladii]
MSADLLTLIASVADAVRAGAPAEAVLARIDVVRTGLQAVPADHASGSCEPDATRQSSRELALLTVSDLGGNVSPLTLGHALEPTLITAEAGGLGGSLLAALVRHGLVTRTGHARYTLTDAGLAELHRLGCRVSPTAARTAAERQRTALDRLLLVFAGLGHAGGTAMQFGVAMTGRSADRPTRSIGSVRLTALKESGFVARVRPNWWALTETGRAHVARLRAEGAGA